MNVYQGESLAGGIALGQIHLQGYDQSEAFVSRISSDQVEGELNMLRVALGLSREQIEKIRSKQEGNLSQDELRIFDAHISYLQDPMFVNEIEKLVMEKRLHVRESILRVVENYDRIFALVECEHLRQRASDFRDVATRVLRNLGDGEKEVEAISRPSGAYILAARKLSTADMFDLDNEKVAGIVAEEGGISSHAGILARSMGIPTITGIRDLPSKLENGEFVVLDGEAGELHVRPDDRLVEEFQRTAQQFKDALPVASSDEAPHATRDGTEVKIHGSCGSVGEANLVRAYAMDGVGLFRTELLFLAGSRMPSEDMLVKQYEEVVRARSGTPVNFRLLDVGSSTQVEGVAFLPERNSAMGLRGIRNLLVNADVLRLQLRAILRAAAGASEVAILVPFVTGISDLQRVRAAILEERQSLRKRGVACADSLLVAPIIEVPAAAFMLRAFLDESDFVVVALDDLQAYLLAADRDNVRVRDYYEMLHPGVFELLARLAREAEGKEKRLILFGEGAGDPTRIPFYVGIGIREFSVAPVRMDSVLKGLERFAVDECQKIAARILEAPRSLEVQRLLLRLASR